MARKFTIDYGEEELNPILDARQWICIRQMYKTDVPRVNKIDAKSMESTISEKWFAGIIDDAPDLQFVAVDARTNPMAPESIVGFVVGRPYDPANKSHLIGYISRIAVLQPYRNHGIGTMLENAFEYGLLSRGVGDLLVHSRVGNMTATRFYHGLGLQDIGIVPGHYKKPPADGVAMRKQLHPGQQYFNSCFPM